MSKTLELQSEIKKLIAELDWSQEELARIIYIEINEIDTEDEIRKFVQKLKKELQRSTTKPDLLQKYISIIGRHPDFVNTNKVLNRHYPAGNINQNMTNHLKKISNDLSKELNKKSL